MAAGEHRLAEELGRTPTPEEIARVLGLPRKKLPIIKKAIRIYNLTPQTDQADAGWSLGEMVMDERTRTPEDETGRTRQSEARDGPVADHGSARGDRVADAIRTGRQ